MGLINISIPAPLIFFSLDLFNILLDPEVADYLCKIFFILIINALLLFYEVDWPVMQEAYTRRETRKCNTI
jgi:hypothetical protein